MLNFKGIILESKVSIRGPYVTSATADKIVDFIVNTLNIEEELYADGRRHIGTEFSKIYKELFPKVLKNDEMLYLKLTKEVTAALDLEDIKYSPKPLTLKQEGDKYAQLVSFDILAIYLGKFKLSDKQIHSIIKLIKPITLKIADNMCIPGNKPVKIEGKPLVKLISSMTANEQIVEDDIITKTSKGLEVHIPTSCQMEYVKAGTLLRKDLYIAIKALSASQERHMYEVIEDLLLGKSVPDLSILDESQCRG